MGLMPRTFFVSRTPVDRFSRHPSFLGVYPAPLSRAESRVGPFPGIDLDIGEAIPYVLVEVPALGFGAQQFPIDLFGNTEVTVDRPAPEFQFQRGALVLVGSGIQ